MIGPCSFQSNNLFAVTISINIYIDVHCNIDEKKQQVCPGCETVQTSPKEMVEVRRARHG